MALTPDDIVNRTFETTRFRDGYDQDEVDNFLDEIVAEMRGIIAEKERLEARVAELESGAQAAPATPAEPESAEAETAAVVETPAAPPTAPAAAEPAAQTDAASASVSPEGLLALAQRVHDEHVAEGERRKDELVAEAERQAADIEQQATQRKADLEQEFERTKADREKVKAELETKIDELQTFERDYRLKLRGYIESQLRDLDRTSFAFGGAAAAPTQQ